jgi:alcohol dehydrogenase class IV
MNETVHETPAKTSKAVEALKHGAADAAEAANKVSAGICHLLSSTVYGAFYGVSYGVVFSALLVAKVIPAGSPAEKGILDGARAAKAKVEKPASPAEWTEEAHGLAA